MVPVRVQPGYEAFSFGRKGEDSPFATARVLAALLRVSELAEQIAAVDVEALGGGGPIASDPEQPRATSVPVAVCPVPASVSYDSRRVLPRILGRQHLATAWEPQSLESIAADVVALSAGDPAATYLSMAARHNGLSVETLDDALDVRRSLVRLRAMRGVLYAVRRDAVQMVHAASVRQVVKHARGFVRARGLSTAEYEAAAARVETVCDGEMPHAAETYASESSGQQTWVPWSRSCARSVGCS